MLKRFPAIRAGAVALGVMFFGSAIALFAQTGPQLPNPIVIGKLIAATGSAPPVGTGCTIAAGSNDIAGNCTATAASGSIAFGTAYATAPNCLLVDQSATPAAVYAVTTTQITLTTITSGHLYQWHCVGKTGG